MIPLKVESFSAILYVWHQNALNILWLFLSSSQWWETEAHTCMQFILPHLAIIHLEGQRDDLIVDLARPCLVKSVGR